ncbi:MAG: ParB N-terminal domain-containing protein [Sphingopyxis sp.]|nr:ParB N-terminal domain-containing protein [Sphingopyxis sp.]
MGSLREPGRLREIAPEKIRRNPENPRLFFRAEEMDTLLASIKRYGVQVPITVYAEGDHFVLIDGERRWRCATKLNFRSIPALVQTKPSPLDNLLLMFNIHALREQWDYLTIAKKLPVVIDRFEEENGIPPNEIELSEITGLTRGQIRRCRYLLDLPQGYREILENELELPKKAQKLSEDFFIEMERSLKTVYSRLSDSLPPLNAARDALIDKFRDGKIKAVTDFRMLSKIATSIENLDVRESKAAQAIKEILDRHSRSGISEVYAEHFEVRYDERKVRLNVDSIYEYLNWSIEQNELHFGENLIDRLRELRDIIDQLLDD